MVSEIRERFEIARPAIEAVGASLIRLRGRDISSKESFGGQLKTAVDKTAEAWLIKNILTFYPTDCVLAEESFEEEGNAWVAPSAFWTVDALDGTRSFIEGFDGFCVQVAYIVDGIPMLGIINEPVRQMTYWAIRGYGAYRQRLNGKPRRLRLPHYSDWSSQPVFVDSTYPEGVVGQLMILHNGQFLECGSIGLKICRVAEAKAHVFAKALVFKLWDIAPGQLILSEAGGRLALWDGSDIPFDTYQVYFNNLVAAPAGLFSLVVSDLCKLEGQQ